MMRTLRNGLVLWGLCLLVVTAVAAMDYLRDYRFAPVPAAACPEGGCDPDLRAWREVYEDELDRRYAILPLPHPFSTRNYCEVAATVLGTPEADRNGADLILANLQTRGVIDIDGAATVIPGPVLSSRVQTVLANIRYGGRYSCAMSDYTAIYRLLVFAVLAFVVVAQFRGSGEAQT